MQRLIYTSTAKSLMDERDLSQILRSARSSNSKNDITGLLVYHDGCFMQILEGPEAAVQRCYQRIQLDQRHRDCTLLAKDTVVSRMFSTWWMSYQAFDDLSSFQKKQFADIRQFATELRKSSLTESTKVNSILLAFMSAFRDLDMVG